MIAPAGAARDGTTVAVLAEARQRVREGLASVREELTWEGLALPEWEGKLIRPVMGLAGLGHREAEPPLWRALTAVQLAHEASLLHDDVIDGARQRRGVPTMAAGRGVAAALVEGDHLLTASYRIAAAAGSLAWVELFARAVERTVAGEKAQARARGGSLSWERYEEIVLGKSGELMGAALAAGPLLRRERDADRYWEAGRRIGLVYQMLDDLLDYCPHVATGKPSLGDYRGGVWTWPKLYVELPAGLEDADVGARLHARGEDGSTPFGRCIERFRSELDRVRSLVGELLPRDRLVTALLEDWLRRAEEAVARETAATRAPVEREPSEPARVELPAVAGWESLMADHSRSFRFAARLFPAARRSEVVGVYAWCRYTDDLVDGVELPASELEARLDAWLALSRRAWDGEETGNELADRVMGGMRRAGVPFRYAAELVEGMRMDVRGVEYGTLAELRTYTFRVASVVGLWMTELFGIREPWMLDRAASLGRAMQLTNILRDVGEDLALGRLYLPTSWLRAHGLDRAALLDMAAGGGIDDRYRQLVERLLRVAESEYRRAGPAIARLPGFYRRPVAVAADVYRGIHDEIRENDYDNLTLRAYTGLATKLRLGTGALLGRRARGVRGPRRGRPSTAAIVGLAGLLVVPGSPGALRAQAPEPGLAKPGLTEALAGVEAPEGAPMAVAPPDSALEEIGRLWIRAVDESDAVEEGLAAVDRTEALPERATPGGQRLLRAYRGSFTTLRAKHGGWPRERLRNLRKGFELMDAVVAEAPQAADLRYVRLMSGFYLPGFFGRSEEAAEDMAALIRLLPDSPDSFPPAVLPEVVRFLLENGSPDSADRERLARLLP